MNYFTKDLLFQVNSVNETDRNIAENRWKENTEKYERSFNKVKKYLSTSFLKQYQHHRGFHDYLIESICISYDEQGNSMCHLKLSNFKDCVSVSMYSVSAINIDVHPTAANFSQIQLLWGYCEFERPAKGILRLSVLCASGDELVFEFGKITSKTRKGQRSTNDRFT